MTTPTSLYGIPRPQRSTAKEIPSSTTLAFTSQLTSLLSNTRPQSTTTARPRPSKTKPSIFTSHNKNARKRAAADISSPDGPSTSSTQIHNNDIGTVDASTLHRSKRKMEEKARLYAAMKRGDYIPPSNSKKDARLGLIDFDRKWAENEAAGRSSSNNNYETESDSQSGGDSSNDDHNNDPAEQVEYEDEFGRLRKGSRSFVARELRRRTAQSFAAAEASELSARPAMPAQLIYGDTVQAGAFNPDEPVAMQMEEIARKRDRSVTPPEETHYDASKEVRSKGVGFYAFSGGKEERGREMNALEQERRETERARAEKEAKKEKRKLELEERRRIIREKRGEKLADRFLDGLGGEIGEEEVKG